MSDYEYMLPEGRGGEYISANERLDRLEKDVEDLRARMDAQQIIIERLLTVQEGAEPWLLERCLRWLDKPTGNLLLDLAKSLLAIAIHACFVAGVLMLVATLLKGAFQ